MSNINFEPQSQEHRTSPTQAVLPRWISSPILRAGFALGLLTGGGASIAEAAPARTVALGSCDVPQSSGGTNPDRIFCPELPGPLTGRLRMMAYWANPENPNDLMAGINDRLMKVELNGDIYWFRTKKTGSDGTGYLVASPDKEVMGTEPTELPVPGDCSDRADFFNSQKGQVENACAELFRHWRVSSTNPDNILEGPFNGAVRECPEDQVVDSEEYQWRRNDQGVPRSPFREPLNRDSRTSR